MKSKRIRRILTFIFTLTFITSTLLGTLPAFASSTNKTDLVTISHSTEYTGVTVVNVTENVLLGAQPYINKYYAPAGTVKSEEFSLNNPGDYFNLTDGDFDTEWRVSQGMYHSGSQWFFDGSVYNQLAYDLGKEADITDIVVAHSATSTLATGKYKVYVSNNKDTLFNDVNLVADVDNTTTDKRQQTISTKEGKTLNGRYVGIIITMPCISTTKYGGETIYARIREIGVYAKDTTPLPAARATLDTADNSLELPTLDTANNEMNLTAGRVATYYKNTGGKDIQVLPDSSNSKSETKLKTLTDGQTDKDGEDYSFVGYEFRFGTSNPKAFFNGRYSSAFVYDLGSSFELTKLALVHGSKGALATNHYMVYASNSRDNLFKDESFVLEVKNTGANQRNLITFQDGVKAKYVGIRVWDPCSDYTQPVLADTPTNAYVRMREIAVYGKVVDAGLFTATSDDSTATDTTLGDSNVLSGKAVTKIYYYGPGVTEQRYDDTGKLTDGDVTNDGEWRQSGSKFADTANNKVIGNGINIGDYKLDIIFGLGSTHEITGFEVFNATNNQGNSLANYRYQVYIANSQSELFYPENMVMDFTNEDAKGRNAFKLTSGKEAIKGKFYGVRILDPTCSKTVDLSNIYPRVRELTLYGKRIVTASDAVIMDESKEIPTDLFSGTNIATQGKFESWMMNPFGNYVKVISTTSDQDIMDGDYETEYRSSGNYFGDENANTWIGNGITEGDIYQDLYFDLNYISNITGVVMLNSPTNGLATYKYAIYSANTKKDLFKGEPIGTFTNTDGSLRNCIDLTYLNNNAPINARFLGVRIIDATFKKPTDVALSNCYLRCRDFAIFGTLTDEGADPPPDPNVIEDDTIALPEDWGTNIALGQLPSSYTKDSNGYKLSTAKNAQFLSDGNLKSEFEQQSKLIEINNETGSLIADHTSYGDGQWYTDIVFDFKTEVTVDAIALIHHSTANMITNRYQIYVSDKKSSLFDSANKVRDVDNSENVYRRNAYNFKGMNDSRKGRFVAIRVLAPTAKPDSNLFGVMADGTTFNHVSTRLFECAIYGTYTDPNFVYVEPFTPFIETPEDSYFDGNLLLNKVFDKILFNGVDMTSGRKWPTRGGVLTNGLVKTSSGKDELDRDIYHWDFTGTFQYTALDGSQFTDMYWDLGQNYDITKFAMVSSISDSPTHYTGWYKVYISDDFDLLFDEESVVFEYNALDPEDPSTICRGQEVNFKDPAYGRYMAVRILNPVYTATQWVRPRIVEIGLWGDVAEVDLTPVNITKNMPVTAYLGTIDNLTEVKSSNFSLSEINNLADGDKSTGAKIKTDKKNLNLIYNLCQDAEIYSIIVNSLQGETKLKKYKVYASDTQAGVWDKDSLVYSFSGSGSTGKKNFSTSKIARYVRIEILDKADYLYIGDIQIIGPTAILLRTKNLIKNIPDLNYEFYNQNLKTGKFEDVNPSQAGIEVKKLHDGTPQVATNINGGIEGKTSMDLIIDIGDLRTINNITINFPPRAEAYSPKLTNIYFGVSREDVQTFGNKPDIVVDGTPENGVISKNIIPQTARFVRISFVSANENYGADHMIVALTEISLYGTGVVGTNPDSENVMEFEDKKLGVKWGIAKATDNDIITNIASSKVTVSKVTNWQKRSLEKTPYMEVVGGKKYTFKFYDIAGNEVTDLAGRTVEVAFKLRDGMTADTSMVGYAGNKWYIEAYESDSGRYQGYITAYSQDTTEKFEFSMLKMITSDDEYWSTIGPLEDYGDEKQEYAPTTEEDKTTSTDTIVTEDKDFHIDPQAALRLPVDAQMFVTVTTYTLTPEVYNAVAPLTDPNYIAATYSIKLQQAGADVPFDGSIEVMAKIPDAIKGYFTGYKLIHIYDDGSAEFIDYTRKGDYIFFKTRSLSDFALIGEGYTPDGSAVLEDTNTGSSSDGYTGSTSPETGDATTMRYIIISLISLAAIILLNAKRFGRVDN